MKRKTQWILISVALICAAILFLIKFRSLAMLLLFSAILSYLLHPMVQAFCSRGVPVAVSVLICYGMLLFSVLFLLLVILPEVFSQFRGILNALPVYYEYILSLWDHYMADSGVLSFLQEFGFDEKILSYLHSRGNELAEFTLNAVSVVPKILLYSLLVPVVSYYFLRDKNKIAGNALMIFPPRFRVAVITVWQEIDGVLKGFIGGNLLISLVVGFLTFLGLFFLGVDNAAALGILYGIMDIIPYFGPFLGAIIVVLLPVLQGSGNIFLVILLLFLVQQFENYFISPRVLGDQVGIHPVSVIFLVLIGGSLGGVFGMVLVIPLAAVIKVVIMFLYKKFVATAID